MSLRRNFILLLGVAGCGFVFALSAPTPNLGSIESAAPDYFGALAGAELTTEEDLALVAFRKQARAALVQLQTKAAVSP